MSKLLMSVSELMWFSFTEKPLKGPGTVYNIITPSQEKSPLGKMTPSKHKVLSSVASGLKGR